MTDPPDELDDLLGPPPAAETPGLRASILRRTQHRLARRAWARRAGKAAAVAAVFAAGIGLGVWLAPRGREPVLVPAPAPPAEVVTVPVPILVPVPANASADPTPPGAARTAKALELDAEQADEAPTAARLYRQAGDAYLTAEQDYANATRCYLLFLARGGDAALAPERGDSWLLTSLKNAAFKEKVHATPTDG
jgi:hypothetical protein